MYYHFWLFFCFLQCQVLFQAEVCAVPVRTRSDHSDGVHLCSRASATVSTTATGVDSRLLFLKPVSEVDLRYCSGVTNQSQGWI